MRPGTAAYVALVIILLVVLASMAVGAFLDSPDDYSAPDPDHVPSSGYCAVADDDPFGDDEVIERKDEGVGA